MIQVHPVLASNILDVHGEHGRRWLDQLPGLVPKLEKRWNIRTGKPLPDLTYHLVVPASSAFGSNAILKLGVPGPQFHNEAKCLQHYNGHGAVKLLEYDPSAAAMLLERVLPGRDIRHLDEEEAVRATVYVMDRLHRPPSTEIDLPSVADWGKGFRRLRESFSGGTGPLQASMVGRAEALFHELAESMDVAVVLHGDLHHENILSSRDEEWLAIDPQGVIGEPCYEIGAFLRNPMPEIIARDGIMDVMKKRVSLFSELTGHDCERIRGWGFCQAVLSAIWSLEDHGTGWETGIRVAEALTEA